MRQGARRTPTQLVGDDSSGERDLNHALGREDRETKAGTTGGPSLWRAMLAKHLWASDSVNLMSAPDDVLFIWVHVHRLELSVGVKNLQGSASSSVGRNQAN